MSTAEAAIIDLQALAQALPAWRSQQLGRIGSARLKLLRMDEAPYVEETHDFTEALLVLDGVLRLRVGGVLRVVGAGQLCLLPAGVPHAVDEGSAGSLLIMDT
ncbi:MAG TPA: cupin domain-containing protein [Frateuria sp.]|uniref:cupin domain-containing protein n=1 Tax=Frateuria sp. TaxID=2211372 RepID=UPI002DF4770A|nr:cupin domain-containing protein [Frateuria sp.]